MAIAAGNSLLLVSLGTFLYALEVLKAMKLLKTEGTVIVQWVLPCALVGAMAASLLLCKRRCFTESFVAAIFGALIGNQLIIFAVLTEIACYCAALH